MYPNEDNLFGAIVATSPILCSDIPKVSTYQTTVPLSPAHSDGVIAQCPQNSSLCGFEKRHTMCKDGESKLANCLLCRHLNQTFATMVCANNCKEILSPVNFEEVVYNHFSCKLGD